METIFELKLNVLFQANLLEREMNALKGGNNFTCSCYYQNNGGSSFEDNRNANYLSNYTSTAGCNQYILDDGGNSYCFDCKEK